MALQDSYQQVHAETRRSRSETPSKGKLSRRSSVQAAGAQEFCLGVLALILTLPCNCGVGAITFANSGFSETDVYIVGDSSWIFDPDSRCFSYGAITDAGRFLHPSAVQMKDPGATAVKSFSTSFIYQMRASFSGINGPGLAFIIVPDNVTIGGSAGYMGVITTDTSDTTKNYESDNYTFAVELDTHNDTMFGDPNDNHIGVNLASMISSHLIKPDFILASESTVQYQQIWIEYTGATSAMDIYSGYYGQAKPDKPQGSQLLVDLSYLKESMYIGFSTGTYIDDPAVFAWSYSNDGVPAPPIYINQAAPPAAPSPPPDISYPSPPSPGPQAPPPGPAKAPPPPSPVPPTPSPRSSPSPLEISPPPVNPPNPFNPPPFIPPIAPPAAPPAGGRGKKKLWITFGVSIGVLVAVACIPCSLCRWVGLRRPFRVFISHTGGPDGSLKNFPIWLNDMMTRRRWSKFRFRVKIFFDQKNCEMGLGFADDIGRELARFDVGIVVVTKDFFERKWPMTELIAFVEAQQTQPALNGRIRVLPLFYELTPDDVKAHLEANTWENHWDAMNRGTRPLTIERCTAAVRYLCTQRGVPYVALRRDHDQEYANRVCEAVDTILRKERSWKSDFWWAMPACIQKCHRTPAQRGAMTW